MSKTNMPSVQGSKGSKPTLAFPGSDAPDGLHVQLLDAGTGPEVKAGDTISAHYLGQSWNGSVFDNSYDRGQPLNFRVGVGEVIRGWDDGLVGQRVGSRVLLCPSPPNSATATTASRKPASRAGRPWSSSPRSSASPERPPSLKPAEPAREAHANG